MRIVLTLFCMLFLLPKAWAAEDRYSCTIERGYSLGASGLSANRRVLAAVSTRTFEIDRQTGAVTGNLLDNTRFTATVVSRGSSENPFQVYWVVRGVVAGPNLRFVEVQEYEDGPRKPFRAVVQNWTYTGYCE